ncbi:MAG TPA: carboxylesterase family protein [Rhizomicrobium sp.]|jgi:para-nitrobenzyl esterase|nr:carboxylesterase family protein [Rhizomicrobium sp.]
MTNDIFCVADTQSGRVQGLVNAGIRQFKGVPYSASTGDKNRFLPPRKPTPWTGVRECFGYGPVSPQVPTDITNSYGRLIHFDLVPAQGGMSEDCLHLNIWTPALRDGRKRSVMVSIHGGGFAIGSGNAALYDGAELARRGDVVVVTVTHRLAVFGFLDLAALGAAQQFAHAGVVGIMDLVAALEWVRDNIENFGGDPDCVTIFGQSGGGWKVSTMLAAPAAKGLFHRAAVQSGSLLRHVPRELAAMAAEAVIAKLGVTKANFAAIQKLPWQDLLAAQAAVAAALFAPVADGTYLPHDPFEPAAPDESAEVPLIVSTTLDDAGLFLDNFELDDNGLRQLLQARHGDKAEAVLRLYRNRWPRKSPYLLQAQMITDSGFRRFAYTQAESKAAQARAPVYFYQWDWPSPAYGGRFGAAHAIDVPACFANAREAILGAGSGPGRFLCDQLSAAWIAFAKTGDPNNSRIPHWPAFNTKNRPTMIFDDPVRIVNDPNADIRAFWNTMPPAATVFG